MTITTMEELTALPVDTTLTINAQTFRVSDPSNVTGTYPGGATFTIPMHLLEGQVLAGQVVSSAPTIPPAPTTTPIPEPEGVQWYVHRDVTTAAVRGVARSDGTIILFGSPGSLQHSPPNQQRIDETLTVRGIDLTGMHLYHADERFCTQVDRPADAAPLSMLSTAEQECDRLRAEVASVTAERGALTAERDRYRDQYNHVVNMRVALDTALSEWARENSEDVTPDLGQILDDSDIDWRGTETVEVQVSISGETEVDFESVLGNSGVEEMIHESRLADWNDTSQSEVTLSWDHSHTFEIEDVTQGDCACGNVDREYVRQYLDDQGFNYSDFSIDDVTCDND